MPFPYPKATVLMASGPTHDPDRKHLFIVLTEPLGDPPEVLLVSLSSVSTSYQHDCSCELHPGDHSFITHPSFIRFDLARIEPAQKLIDGVDQQVFSVREPISEEVYQRICTGLRQSAGSSLRVKNFLQWHVNLV